MGATVVGSDDDVDTSGRVGACGDISFTSEEEEDGVGSPSVGFPCVGRWTTGMVIEGMWRVGGMGVPIGWPRGSILNSCCGGLFDIAGVLTLLGERGR